MIMTGRLSRNLLRFLLDKTDAASQVIRDVVASVRTSRPLALP